MEKGCHQGRVMLPVLHSGLLKCHLLGEQHLVLIYPVNVVTLLADFPEVHMSQRQLSFSIKL